MFVLLPPEAVHEGLQPQGCYWYLDTRAEEPAPAPERMRSVLMI